MQGLIRKSTKTLPRFMLQRNKYMFRDVTIQDNSPSWAIDEHEHWLKYREQLLSE